MSSRSIFRSLFIVGITALTLVACDSSDGSMTSSELATSLKVGMQADSDNEGVKIGDVTCDNGLANVGDMALCKVHLDDGSPDSGIYQFDVTLKDTQGHFVYTPEHKIK